MFNEAWIDARLDLGLERDACFVLLHHYAFAHVAVHVKRIAAHARAFRQGEL